MSETIDIENKVMQKNSCTKKLKKIGKIMLITDEEYIKYLNI
jgi:hypothetical protein